MPPRAPDFWGPDSKSFWRHLLSPFSLLFSMGGKIRQAQGQAFKADIPVFCVGNLVAGGAGKTPTAIAISQLASVARHAPHFLSRGYGGSLGGPVAVDIESHHAGMVGDEALLLARVRPCWVSQDRPAGARKAQNAGAKSLILDDGYQNPKLYKDISILVVDGHYGFGNGKVMPAGPLRETIADGLARADLLILLGEDAHGIRKLAQDRKEGPLPVLRAQTVPTGEALAFAGKRVIAFAGIARPEKVFTSLQKLGCVLEDKITFPDHHPYRRDEIEALLAQAHASRALLVTTPKDLVRIPDDLRCKIAMLGVSVVWDEPEEANDLFAALLKSKAGIEPEQAWETWRKGDTL